MGPRCRREQDLPVDVWRQVGSTAKTITLDLTTETVVMICNKFHDSVETDAIGLNVIWWVEGDRVTRKGMHREAYMVLKIR